MSNLQSKLGGVRFEPVPAREPPRPPGEWIIIVGVVYPTIVILLELVSRMCAGAFFDPLPTYWHVAAAGFVPASNLLVWKCLQDGPPRNIKWLAFANGAGSTRVSLRVRSPLPH